MAQRRSRTLRARLFAVTALLALAATYLTPIIDADWNAWRYDHGHASLTAVGTHSHPWDASGDSEAHEDGDGFVFTSSSDSVPGITAIWAPSTGGVVTLLRALLIEGEAVTPPQLVAAAPLSPPPEVALSRT